MYRKLECVGLLILVGLVMTAEMTKLDRRYLSAGQGIPETKKPVIGKHNLISRIDRMQLNRETK